MDARQQRKEAATAYGDWIAQAPWDLLITITDPGMSHPDAMYRQTMWYLNKVNRKLYGKNWFKRTKGIEFVFSLERQKRGSVHSHALVRFPDHECDGSIYDLMQSIAVRRLDPKTGKYTGLSGFYRIERPQSQEHIVNYVCKYVTKEGEIHLAPRFHPDQPRTREAA